MFLLTLSNSDYHLKYFNYNWKNVEKFLKKYKLDGIELLKYKSKYINNISNDHLRGLHLRYFPIWLEFYQENKKKLKQIFGSEKEIINYYGSLDKKILIDIFKKEYETAINLNVNYMVYHVSHVTYQDAFTFDYNYTSREVIDASVDLINKVFNKDSEIELLFENLWWPGLKLTNPKLTEYFLSKIKYKNKGIMLDLSHLINTNKNLNNMSEANNYILQTINNLGYLKKYIKGIHVNKSLVGYYFQKDHKKKYNEILKLSKENQMKEIFKHISKMDPHLPFNDEGLRNIITSINPEYVVYEFKYDSFEKLEKYVNLQNQILNR